MTIIHILFWLMAFLIFWTYFGYYLVLKAISLVYAHKKIHTDDLPPVSMIVTCYNEELRIREKLENTLEIDYPRELLEVIFVSDGSTDQTDEIISEYADRGITLMRMEERNGKHYGQGRGIQASSSEIVVCSDATTFLDPDAVRMIVRNFADSTIGCVSGWDRILGESGEGQGEGIYIRYEMNLRELESQVGSLVGISGCFFATRKSVCSKWIDNMSSDFYLPIVARSMGLRSAVEKQAIGAYRVLQDTGREFTRKVRTVLHGIEVLFRFPEALNPFKFGAFAIQMISHKLLKWLVPVWMVLAMPLNILLIGSGDIYSLTLAAQILFYILVTIPLLHEPLGERLLFRIPLFLFMANMSILVAWYKYFTRQGAVVWDVTKR